MHFRTKLALTVSFAAVPLLAAALLIASGALPPAGEWAVLLAGILGSGGGSFLIAGRIARPITALERKFRDASQGGLLDGTGLAESSSVDPVSAAADQFLKRIQEPLKSIRQLVDRSRETSGSLSDHLGQAVSSLTQISAGINTVSMQSSTLDLNIASSSSAVEEIFANTGSLAERIIEQASAVAETSAAVEQMSASVDNVARIARERKEATDQLEMITSRGGDKVDETYEVIGRISRSIGSMQEMIEIINSVASQTNLLSMNAAIEAAHAGEFGKGFAVVADEIGKLAESTGNNARNISTTLTAMIKDFETALQASTESGEAFRNIRSGVREAVEAFSEISQSTEEVSAGGREILSAATSLLSITEEIRGGSQEMRIGAQEVTEALIEIRRVSSEALSGIQEIGAGTNEINRVLIGLSDLSIRNNRGIDQLDNYAGQILGRSEAAHQTLDFTNARLMHQEWIAKVRLFLNGKFDLDDTKLSSHRECELGRWLYSEGLSRYGTMEEMVRLEKEHESLHRTIRDIVEERQEKKDRERIDLLFRHLLDCSRNVLALLGNIEGRISRSGDSPEARPASVGIEA